MRQHKLFVLLITAVLMEAAVCSISLNMTPNANPVKPNQREWYMLVDEDSRNSSSLLPASSGIESPLENHHLLEKGTYRSNRISNSIRLPGGLRLTKPSYSSPCKMVRLVNSWPFNSGQYPSIPIAFRKLII